MFGRSVRIHGNFTVLRPENVTIGSNCAINHGVFVQGFSRITIGDNVVLSPRAMLIDSGITLSAFGARGKGAGAASHVESYIVLEDGAWIGAGAIILPGVTVGAGSVVGAGSIVTRDVPPGTVVAGNPARVIRELGRG